MSSPPGPERPRRGSRPVERLTPERRQRLDAARRAARVAALRLEATEAHELALADREAREAEDQAFRDELRAAQAAMGDAQRAAVRANSDYERALAEAGSLRGAATVVLARAARGEAFARMRAAEERVGVLVRETDRLTTSRDQWRAARELATPFLNRERLEAQAPLPVRDAEAHELALRSADNAYADATFLYPPGVSAVTHAESPVTRRPVEDVDAPPVLGSRGLAPRGAVAEALARDFPLRDSAGNALRGLPAEIAARVDRFYQGSQPYRDREALAAERAIRAALAAQGGAAASFDPAGYAELVRGMPLRRAELAAPFGVRRAVVLPPGIHAEDATAPEYERAVAQLPHDPDHPAALATNELARAAPLDARTLQQRAVDYAIAAALALFLRPAQAPPGGTGGPSAAP